MTARRRRLQATVPASSRCRSRSRSWTHLERSGSPIPGTRSGRPRAGVGCARAAEGLFDRSDEPVEVAGRDHPVRGVWEPRPFRRRGRVGVMAECVEDRLGPAPGAVGAAELEDEARRRVRDVRPGERVVVSPRRRSGCDHVHPRACSVEDVVAALEQGLVHARSAAGGRGVELVQPERGQVRLVPDHHVVHLRKPGHDVADVGAILVALRRGLWRRVAVGGDDDPVAPCGRHRRAERAGCCRRERRVPRAPDDGHGERAQSQVASRRGNLDGPGLERVVGEPDDHARRGRCGRAGHQAGRGDGQGEQQGLEDGLSCDGRARSPHTPTFPRGTGRRTAAESQRAPSPLCPSPCLCTRRSGR